MEMDSDVWKNQNAFYIKFCIFRHLRTTEWPNIESLKPYSHVDHEWYRIFRIFERYQNAGIFMRQMSPIEFELSFKKFDPICVRQVCFGNLINNNDFLLCIEPKIPSDFIETFVRTFLDIEKSTKKFTSLHIAKHTFLHQVWLSAAKLEVRPEKLLSGLVSNRLCSHYDFTCKCSKTCIFDSYIFKNHKINVGLKIRIYYLSKLHKLAVRFIKFDFFEILPLYVRKRPRRLPLDALFDVTTFLPRNDLDSCQVASRELFYFIENNKNGFALHNISTARLVTKGDFFCFGVFDEDLESEHVRDFRERRSNLEVTKNLFYPLLRNASINKLHLKRIDFGIVFEHFKVGISQCTPLNVRRLVFSAKETDYLSEILEFTECVLKIREYEIEVFSNEFMNRLLLEPAIHRCNKIIIHEQYQSNRPLFDQLLQFLIHSPRPNCQFTLRNFVNEENVNSFLDKIAEDFVNTKDINSYRNSTLIVLNPLPRVAPRLLNLIPNQQNVNSAFKYETPTLSDVYYFKNRQNSQILTFCLGKTMFHPIRRVCYFKLGKIVY